MKVTAYNGSPRRGGNTEFLLKKVLEVIENNGIKTQLIQLGGRSVRGCTACMKCRELKNRKCIIDDYINECIEKAFESDAIILGSPTYFTDVTAELKAFIDRLGYVAIGNGRLLNRKIGAAVVAVRRAGAIHTFDTINHLFLMNQMIVPGSTYWNLGIGLKKLDVKEDNEGVRNMTDLGETISWLMKKING